MNKPKKKSFENCYSYHDIIHYIEDKYKIETRGYKEKLDGKYRDFWHWVLEGSDIHNGCFTYFPEDWRDGDEEYSPWWVKEIMELIVKEFFPDENEDMKVWVEW